MPLPETDDVDTFGGAHLVDYAGQAVVDSTTDRGADAVNTLVNDVAMMTHLALRAWVKFTPGGTAAPALTASDTMWAGAKDDGENPLNAAPTVERSTTGVYEIVFPTSVFDEIPEGSPGYVGAHTLNLRDAWCPAVYASSTLYQPVITSVSGNVVTVTILVAGTPTDPNGPTFSLFAI
jgi:hypothetical protein